MFWTRFRIGLILLLLVSGFVLAAAPEWPAFQDDDWRLRELVGRREFDFLLWELGALRVKAEAALVNGQAYVRPAARRQLVLDYLSLLGEIRSRRRQIELIYADPAQVDPAQAAGPAQAELAGLEARAAELQPVAEAVVEQQVTAILAENGLGLLGVAWPPVAIHMTPLPLILIVSPRHEIRQAYNIPLEHGLPIPEQDQLENEIYARLDLSALVVPIGGLGIFPAMVVQNNNLDWLANTVAHEWAHHWLSLHPLGASYGVSPDLRTINETVASIVGNEIGPQVLARYYPELASSPGPPGGGAVAASPPAEPPAFDFRTEMRATRLEVDRLLAAGQVEAAEAYMETRRQIFWDNGYQIRKLNQAYFAFYGAYADSPGATGGDPIGPMVLAIRQRSDSLRTFLDRMAPVTSFAELQEVLNELEP